MAPSRGLRVLQSVFKKVTEHHSRQLSNRRSYSTFYEKLADPSNRVQSYISRSSDPYLNLSIEDHILRHSPPDSTILFLYINRPCVVIGRNQNPWLEVNLGILKDSSSGSLKDTEPPAIGDVDLVRRRSGGGAVFHDSGNVNWSITCPRGDFTRDKHAEMVVRALRKLGIDRARVNERHDIVLDQGHEKRKAIPHDTHRTPYTVDDERRRPLKVSGSAYKLTRTRALHHGTTLLASPNLHIIPQYLRSPAKPYISAKGVESVSSPVANIGLENKPFQHQLQDEFASTYANGSSGVTVDTVGEDLLNIPAIKNGVDELRTANWIYAQTPQFTLSFAPMEGLGIQMTVHHGVIKDCGFQVPQYPIDMIEKIQSALLGKKLQEVGKWRAFLQVQVEALNEAQGHKSTLIPDLLEKLLPLPELPNAVR